jgi:hypothetical protein
MSFGLGHSTTDILTEFTEAVAARGGTVTESFDDGERLFARSTLPDVKPVKPGDGFRRGVAVRATDTDVWLHPYLFRLVCTNGAVVAQTLTSRHLSNVGDHSPEVVAEFVRDAVQVCCDGRVFEQTLDHVHTAAETEVNVALTLMPLFSRFPTGAHPHLLSQILQQLFPGDRHTRYDLMNAVTATARDTRDPQTKWDLEELGGQIAVGKNPTPGRRPSASVRIPELVGG